MITLRKLLCALLVILFNNTSISAQASIFQYGLNGEDLQREFFGRTDSYASRGYRPLRLTGYLQGSGIRYATRWIRESNPIQWRAFPNITGAQFSQLYQELRSSYKPIDVSGFNLSNGQVRHNIIWERNTQNTDWQLWRGLTREEMQERVNQNSSSGFFPVKVEAYLVNGESRYVSIWEEGNRGWRMHNRMTRAQYEALLEEYNAEYDLVHLDAYTVGNTVYYAGIWWRQAVSGWEVRSDRGWRKFQRYLNNNWCEGKRINNFYVAETPSGLRYGGIWNFHQEIDGGSNSTFNGQIKAEIDCMPGRGGVAILNLNTGEEVLFHPDQTFGASSTIKIAILYALLRRIDADQAVNINTRLNVGDQYGTNQGETLRENQSYTLRELAQTMIANSNNWATNRLIDYIGRVRINQELNALGLRITRINRYMTGSGAPSAHNNSGPIRDYEEGWDNISTPREMITLLRRIHTNNRLLVPASHTFFWDTLNRDGDGDVNSKGYLPDFLRSLGNWPSLVTIFNKPGSNTWDEEETYPWKEANEHRQRSEAGRLNFSNGNLVFYAMFVDEADESDSGTKGLEDYLRCIGFKIVVHYAELNPRFPLLCN